MHIQDEMLKNKYFQFVSILKTFHVKYLSREKKNNNTRYEVLYLLRSLIHYTNYIYYHKYLYEHKRKYLPTYTYAHKLDVLFILYKLNHTKKV